MRNVGVMAVGLLALFVATACVPISELGETGAVATAAPQPVATPNSDTPTPSATSEPPTPAATGGSIGSELPASLRRNVAAFGDVSPSSGEESARLAVDGDRDSIWNSNRLALGWFMIAFDSLYIVDRVELVIAQTPAGPTTHEVWLGNGSGTRTLYKRLINAHTEDGQTLNVAIDPPRRVNEVLIRTVDSPSWVAWREVRVLGAPAAIPVEGGDTARWELKKVVAGLNLPVQVTHAGDGSGRIFVVEQGGRIRIVRNGVVEETPFLDISKHVSCCGERGLLNVAFPPDYSAKHYFYVSYTNKAGDTVISRFATTSDSDRADPESEEVVLTIDQPYDTHNGGRLAFGLNDGFLYMGSGDGGGPSFNDPDNRGQDPSTLLGKMLRIDVESGVKPYAIPASNPFVQVEGYRDEIWALGLRNPWGFAFDKETGDLYIPDVGAFTREEVNHQPAGSRGGENYGWRIGEGSICFKQWGCRAGEPCHVEPWICSVTGLTSPVAEYEHLHGCAIVGGVVYRGIRHPFLQGVFIYADFCSGRIWGLNRPEGEAFPSPRTSTEDSQDGWQSTLLLKVSVPVSSIGEDEEGNVYVVGYQDGVISMIIER